MTDIVERLRDDERSEWGICKEAADEIERLRLDAARYRHLRNGDWECFDYDWMRGMGLTLVHGAEAVHEAALDAAVDRAMKA